MFGVGRLGSYISRGVNTVSGQSFGGAVDIIVVEQPGGGFKSSPWYVRFGRSQGVLNAVERVVSINVNGVDADFPMYLDNKAEAFFFRELDVGDGEFESYHSFGDVVDLKSGIWRGPKSKSCNFHANRMDLVAEIEARDKKILPRTNSPRSRWIGFPFGRRSAIENGFREKEDAARVDKASSLEHAEIAANLLEVRWTTNLNATNNGNADSPKASHPILPVAGVVDVVQAEEGSLVREFSSSNQEDPLVSSVTHQDNGSFNVDSGEHSLRLGGEECLGDSGGERYTKAPARENSEEVQFSFSDLDDPKVDKFGRMDSLSPEDWKECIRQDSLESSEEDLTEPIIKDDKLLQPAVKPLQSDLCINLPTPVVNPDSTSSPISISKVHNEAELEFLAPVVESLPNMPFSGDNINPYGVPELLGHSLDSNLEALKIVHNDVLVSPKSGAEQHVAHEHIQSNISQTSEDIKKIVSDPAVEVSLCRHLLYEGMGYEAAALVFDAEKLEVSKFCSLCPDIVKDDRLVVRIGGLYFPWDAALPIASAIGSEESDQILEPNGMITVGLVNKTSEEPQKFMNSRNGSWKVWPFSFRRSYSRKDKDSGSETVSENPIPKDENKKVAGNEVTKKIIRAKVPTSEQLSSLNLKEGKNVVIFTFPTATQENQQVDARIFLWKWNTRIVISDVDGTITKSDVLGQFMPLMGYDWSQTGVTHLFSAIKENGYHLLFLSARSISQAYLTRQFLDNLIQDGKALPEGPVVISPDGLFPSLYREVIRRAPHEFKISCLEDIKALFPQDHSPFYAGFGNRHTDEFSYLKVGIPRGKIFTINPKGQVVVNSRVDTKSYTSLHALVHNMFPPTPVIEQEDFNSWNFWRLPPPDIRI